MSRLLYGALAGLSATLAMTMAMRALARELPGEERYPLPPREITERALQPARSRAAALTVAAHFGFGALAGGLYALLPRRPPGLLFGPLVWGASYLGWVPLFGILKPATSHPAQRNLLMLTVHLVWGACLARGLDELQRASDSIFSSGRLEDRQG